MNVAIVGASGSLGKAFVNHFLEKGDSVYAFSRSPLGVKDISNLTCLEIQVAEENSITNALGLLPEALKFDYIIVCVGMLHDSTIQPEKALKDISLLNLQTVFTINTFAPALLAKHFIPRMKTQGKSIFATISARVGSISDNHLGGWYAYRASKAALNMLLKTLSIEMKRKYKEMVIIGLHPGTVDSNLSKPFQKNVLEGKLFTPEYSVQQMANVLEKIGPQESGKIFAYNGECIPY